GEFPAESVQMMNLIAEKTETVLKHDQILDKRTKSVDMTITEAISQSVAHTAENLDISALITPTQSGHSARMISKYRPKDPIIAVTFSEIVLRRVALVWRVYSILSRQVHDTDELLEMAVQRGLKPGLFEQGSKVITTAGVPLGV